MNNNGLTCVFIISILLITVTLPVSAQAADSSSLSLKPGWNQISSPIASGIDISTIERSCTVLQYKNQKLYAWDAQAQSWIYPDRIDPLKGYWIYAADTCSVPLSGTPATFTTLQLYNGWNKISASGSISAIAGTCSGHISGNWVWNWDKSTEKWIHPTTMQLDKGYWVKVDQDCTIGGLNPDTVTENAIEYKSKVAKGYSTLFNPNTWNEKVMNSNSLKYWKDYFEDSIPKPLDLLYALTGTEDIAEGYQAASDSVKLFITSIDIITKAYYCNAFVDYGLYYGVGNEMAHDGFAKLATMIENREKKENIDSKISEIEKELSDFRTSVNSYKEIEMPKPIKEDLLKSISSAENFLDSLKKQ